MSTRSLPTAPLRIEQLATRKEFLPVVAAWIYAEWWEGMDDISLETLTDRLRAHLVPDRIPMTLVASQGDLPVGTATLLAHDVDTEEWPELSPWVAAVYVVPECRRRGVGGALVNSVASAAGALGTAIAYLLTTEREAFYARLGWKVFDKAGEKIVMARVVTEPG